MFFCDFFIAVSVLSFFGRCALSFTFFVTVHNLSVPSYFLVNVHALSVSSCFLVAVMLFLLLFLCLLFVAMWTFPFFVVAVGLLWGAFSAFILVAVLVSFFVPCGGSWFFKKCGQ